MLLSPMVSFHSFFFFFLITFVRVINLAESLGIGWDIKPSFIIIIIIFIIYLFLFIYLFWLCWVFISVRGLSLVAVSGGHSSLRCTDLSLPWPLLLRSTGSRRAGSVVVAHGPSCSVVCGIFPDQGSNPCPLHWQADSQPLRHLGSPQFSFFNLPAALDTVGLSLLLETYLVIGL